MIYLLECILCNIQYVGKSETTFNIRLNNHWKYVSNPKAIYLHFRKEEQHAKFTLIEQLAEVGNVSKASLRLRLKRSEDFWILKVDTFSPKGLNQELDNV